MEGFKEAVLIFVVNKRIEYYRSLLYLHQVLRISQPSSTQHVILLLLLHLLSFLLLGDNNLQLIPVYGRKMVEAWSMAMAGEVDVSS